MNKQTERFFVEWFVQKAGWSCRIVDDEVPDFRLEFQERVVGLEVTNLYKDEKRKGSFSKRSEALRHKWLSAVARKYYEKSRIPVKLDVLIKSGELKGDPDALASELVEVSDIGVWERKVFDFKPSEKCKLKVWLDRLPDKFERYGRWTSIDNHVGFSRPLDADVIQAIVRKKAARLPDYSINCTETVLLIAADRTYQSGMFHMATESLSVSASGFSAVYLVLYPERYLKVG